MKKGLIILLVVLGIMGIGALIIVPLITKPIVVDVQTDEKALEARSQTTMIVSGVNNYCATADFKEQLNGDFNICSDGVTNEEVGQMIDLDGAKIVSVTYNGKVTDLVVKIQKYTITYDEEVTGDKYIVTKKRF